MAYTVYHLSCFEYAASLLPAVLQLRRHTVRTFSTLTPEPATHTAGSLREHIHIHSNTTLEIICA